MCPNNLTPQADKRYRAEASKLYDANVLSLLKEDDTIELFLDKLSDILMEETKMV